MRTDSSTIEHPPNGALRQGLGLAWKAEWRRPQFRYQLFLSLILFGLVFAAYMRFLNHNETRPGAVLNDPVFAMFQPVDVTWITFAFTYGFSLCGFVALLWTPQRIVFGLQVYVLLALFRIVTIYLVPLEPAPTVIRLIDPVVEFVVNSDTELQRDLFFSGHIATIFMFCLLARGRVLRGILAIGTALVAGCLVLQHVHYTIDVVAAPVACYFAYRLVCLCQARIGYPLRQ